MDAEPTAWPKISVVIITRNRARWLKTALDSVIAQDYPNRELVVVDGGSTDGTVELLRSYGAQVTAWRSEPDRNEADAWNKALKLATGDIVKLLGDDDVLRPGALEIGARWFLEHPETEILFGQARNIDYRVEPPKVHDVEYKLDPQAMTVKNILRRKLRIPYSLTVFLRRAVFEHIGGFSEQYTGVDIDYWARAAKHGIVMGITPEHIADIGTIGENVSLTKGWALQLDLVRAALTYGDVADIAYVSSRYALLRLRAPFARHDLHPLRWLRAALTRARDGGSPRTS